MDYDERYKDIPGAPECWVDGYDAGFAGVYDKDRANECNNILGDQYNRSWPYGCIDSGLTEGECNDIKNDPDDNVKPTLPLILPVWHSLYHSYRISASLYVGKFL